MSPSPSINAFTFKTHDFTLKHATLLSFIFDFDYSNLASLCNTVASFGNPATSIVICVSGFAEAMVSARILFFQHHCFVCAWKEVH